MATTQDELQIRLGLTVTGAQQARSTAGQLEGRVQKVQTAAKAVDPVLRKLESRIAAVQKAAVKNVGKALVADAINQGLQNMTPHAEAGAFAGIAQLGTSIGINSIFLGGRLGPIIGALTTSISLINTAIDKMREEDKAKFDAFQKRLDAMA